MVVVDEVELLLVVELLGKEVDIVVLISCFIPLTGNTLKTKSEKSPEFSLSVDADTVVLELLNLLVVLV